MVKASAMEGDYMLAQEYVNSSEVSIIVCSATQDMVLEAIATNKGNSKEAMEQTYNLGGAINNSIGQIAFNVLEDDVSSLLIKNKLSTNFMSKVKTELAVFDYFAIEDATKSNLMILQEAVVVLLFIEEE